MCTGEPCIPACQERKKSSSCDAPSTPLHARQQPPTCCPLLTCCLLPWCRARPSRLAHISSCSIRRRAGGSTHTSSPPLSPTNKRCDGCPPILTAAALPAVPVSTQQIPITELHAAGATAPVMCSTNISTPHGRGTAQHGPAYHPSYPTPSLWTAPPGVLLWW
jgi:hypothetical protein